MKIERSDITQDLLKEFLNYNPKTGVLTWKVRRESKYCTKAGCNNFNIRLAGKPAFTATHKYGYSVGCILGVGVKAHRVIWMLVYGEWPENIDHINGNRSDNRISNLRSVSTQENSKNRRALVRRGSRVHGIVWLEKHGKWWPRINDENGRQVSLGLYEDLDDAREARRKAEIKYGYHKNHGVEALCKY